MSAARRSIVVLGNGIAGMTAALRLRERLPEARITMVSGESTFPYSRPALMYVFMGHMRYADTKPFEDRVWREQRIDLVRDWALEIDTAGRHLVLQKSGLLPFDELVIASGSKSNRFGWPGEDLAGVQGLYDLIDLRALVENVTHARRAVIIGGGLIGIELAEMLHSRGLHVEFLVREASYWSNVLPAEESAMVNRVVRKAGFGLHLATNLRAILDDGHGRAGSVETDAVGSIDCQFVGLTAGVSPNIELVQGGPVATGRGILVDRSLRTGVAGIYAAGDCAEIVAGDGRPNLLQQVWYTGKAQGRCVADVIAGDDCAYEPGIWYNSAKFLDLEYQTYGDVNRRHPDEENLYWEHGDGLKSFRLVHVAGRVIGVNLMGIRYRHRRCEEWIRAQRDVDWVLDHLDEGNFDPEFSPRYEAEIRRAFTTPAR